MILVDFGGEQPSGEHSTTAQLELADPWQVIKWMSSKNWVPQNGQFRLGLTLNHMQRGTLKTSTALRPMSVAALGSFEGEVP